MSKKPILIDLFAGCGGFSYGLEKAGFKPVFVNELNQDALDSYLRNREHSNPLLKDQRFHCNNIKSLVVDPSAIKELQKNLKKEFGISKKDIDLLVGGPPCQGYSGIGHRRSYSVDKKQLPSNHLYQDMFYVISQLKPKVFVFENVRGLLSARWSEKGTKGEIWSDILKLYRSLSDYSIEYELVYAKDYGVPQNRPRILMVGVRSDIDLKNWHEENSGVANGFLPSPSGISPDLGDLLGDLVDVDYENGGATTSYKLPARTAVQKKMRRDKFDLTISKKGELLTEHEYSRHSDKVLKKFDSMIRNNGVISKKFKTKKFAQRLLPKFWDENGPSITATSLPDDYVHFSQPRILTVREWARLQGFPDWYQFSGKRTTGGVRRAGNPREGEYERELPKYTQIGNAVPVALAEAVGRHIMKILV